MRRNIFTSYIICNRLNLEAFFEPIINFIEIGKPRGLPLLEPYMRISSRTAQAETPKYWLQRICIESLKLLNPLIQSSLKIRRNKNPKALLCGDNTKISSRLIYLCVDRYRPFESSLSLFLFI